MPELRQMLALWRAAKARGEDICVATVVGVSGSAYRKPGARMLITSGGSRSGTISGGCLESEVGKRAWWLTSHGAALESYNSFFDEDTQTMQGLGCGGTVTLLLERGPAADAAMLALACAVELRNPVVLVYSLHPSPGLLHCESATHDVFFSTEYFRGVETAFAERRSFTVEEPGRNLFIEYLAPPPAVWIFGAGDDAMPLAELANSLDWHVTVADGRSHLARAERFPSARVLTLDLTQLDLAIKPEDAAVVMTHSYEQDRRLLPALLSVAPRYLGVLGPRKRTAQLIREAAAKLGLAEADCMTRLHSPAGLNLGGASPAAIALSIVAEMQSHFAGRAAAFSRNSAEAICV